jgi:hypothetical protein
MMSGAVRRTSKLKVSSLRGALATKQSILSLRRAMDCFASLAMTDVLAPIFNLQTSSFADLPPFTSSRKSRATELQPPHLPNDFLNSAG